MGYPNLLSGSKKIGIFGGSFNPLHKGHLKILYLVKKKELVDEIVVVPNYKNPLEKKDYYLLVKTRLKILQQVIGKQQRYHLWSYECEQKRAVSSIETLALLQKKFLKKEFFWILGADSFATISHWQKADEFQNMVNFIVFPRKNISIKPLHNKKKVIFLDSSFDLESSFLRKTPTNYESYILELKNYFQKLSNGS